MINHQVNIVLTQSYLQNIVFTGVATQLFQEFLSSYIPDEDQPTTPDGNTTQQNNEAILNNCNITQQNGAVILKNVTGTWSQKSNVQVGRVIR